MYCSLFVRKSTNSVISFLASSMPATSAKVRFVPEPFLSTSFLSRLMKLLFFSSNLLWLPIFDICRSMFRKRKNIMPVKMMLMRSLWNAEPISSVTRFMNW